MPPRKTALLLVLIIMLQLAWMPQASISSDPHAIPMATGIYVSGNITNNSGGLPVSGANITFFNSTTGAYVNSTGSNGTGFYNITLDSGEYNITVSAADHYTNRLNNINLNGNSTLDLTLYEIPGSMDGLVDDYIHSLAGVTVNITYIPVNQSVSTSTTLTTDSGGRFHLAGISTGACSINISAAGYPTEERTVSISWNRTINTDIHLNGATLTGFVRDNSGNPMTAAISLENGTAWFNTTAGADGKYSISGLRAGEYNITASESGYVPYENTSIPVSSGATLWENCTLKGGLLAGNVTDDAGRPLALVSISLLESGMEIASTETNTAGGFEIASVPTGDYVLRASMTGYLQSSENVHISAGHTTYTDVILTGGEIIGSITDDAGRPISGATVELLGSDYVGTSNESGNYSVSGVAEGDYYVRASREGYITSISDNTLHIAPGSSVFQNFTLRGGTLTGTVDNGSAELAGVHITLILTTGENLTATTDSDGRYMIKGIPEGVYAIIACLDGYTNSTVGGVSITAGETTTLDLTMVELQGAISGNVKSGGAPVEGARVWVSITDGIRFAYTDSRGNYTITDVPAGVYNVTAEKDGYYPDYVPDVVVVRGQVTWEVNLTLEGKLSRLSGVVSNGTYPIVGVSIEILELKYTTHTDPYGNYIIENIPPGTYTVVATKQGYRPNATYGVSISMGEAKELNFTLEEIPGIVWGYVKDGNGDPIVQATVEIPGEPYSTTTDINGYYKLAGVLPGVYSLSVYKSGYETAVISGVNITTEYENHVDVTLKSVGGSSAGHDIWTIIPGMDSVHSFMVLGLIIVLAMMLISIVHMYRHGRKFADTKFMNMLKEMASEEKGEGDEGEKTEEENESGTEDGGTPPSEKKTKKKRLKKGKK